ncbi:MAG: putative blue pigment (indigoidine) exporter [Pseudonocardiales bacterium]|nr:putative blue pigment (indigoidine) exporter [Pseudonocardiales bacterium]
MLRTAAAPAIWGSTYLITVELLPPGRPLLDAVMRALPAGLVLVLLGRRLPEGSWWWRAAVLGALNIGGFFALLFVAAYRLPGGVAATVGAVQPLMVTGLAARLLGERLTPARILIALVGVLGVALLVLRADAQLDPVGVVAALAAAGFMATGVVLTKRWRPRVSSLTLTGWQLVAGGAMLLPLTLVTEGIPQHLSAKNIVGFGYLAVLGTGIAYVLWFRGLRTLSAGNVTFLGLCSPLVATVLGWAFLGQSLTPWQAVGAAIVVIAVITAQRHLTRSPGADLRAQTVPVMDSSAERPGMDGEDASAGNSRPSASRSS